MGDYFRVWRVPATLSNEPDVLPARYARPLQLQSVAGLAMSVATLGGLVGLAVRTARQRDSALATLLAALDILALSFVGFLVRYPKLDGDNMNALYVLNAAQVLAVERSLSRGSAHEAVRVRPRRPRCWWCWRCRRWFVVLTDA